MKFAIPTNGESSSFMVNFGKVFCAPWVRGFYKEEPWFYLFFRISGMSWKNTTFMAKTVTLHPHEGNVPLKKNGRPAFPLTRYVYWNPFKKFMVNSFGLSNPGFWYCYTRWQEFETPFIVSIISLKDTLNERHHEIEQCVQGLQKLKSVAKSTFAIQFNAGCPNDGPHNTNQHKQLIDELFDRAQQLHKTGLPILLNCSPAMPLSIILAVHEKWDGLIIGNTILFGNECIDWEKVTEDGVSPLIKRGLNVLGGYSGKEATPISIKLIEMLRKEGVKTPIIGGNSVQNNADVDAFYKAGANGIIIGSLSLNNPLEMEGVVSYANSLDWDNNVRSFQ